MPVAINIGTGGDAPPWLKPFANWLWPIAVGCVLLVIALELWDRRAAGGTISASRPNDPRNVELALTQMSLLTTPLMLAIMILARPERGSEALVSTAEPAARRRMLFDAYIVEVLARRRSNEVGHPERVLRAVRTLAVAAEAMNTGVRVPPLDFDKADKLLPDPVKGVATLWVASIAVVASALAWTWATIVHFGQGLAVLVFGVIGLLGVFAARSGRWPAPVRRPLALLGIGLAVAAVPVGLAMGVLELFSAPVSTLRITGVAVVLLATLALVIAGMWETPITAKSTSGDQLLFIGFGLGAAVGVVLIGLRPALLQSWALTFAVGTYFMTAVLLTFGLGNKSGKPPPGARRIGRTLLIVYIGAGLGLMLAMPGRWNGPLWEPIGGTLIGLLYALIAGVVLMFSIGNPAIRAAMVISGEPVPWRRRFLRFAADRSLLTHADGEYRFVHLIIRDHLAQCAPERLAAAVLRRRAQLPEG